MPALSGRLAPIAAMALLLLGACSHDRTPAITCGADTLNVHRVIQLEASSPPLAELLAPGEVVLTFDDGPHPGRTRPVLRLLASECTQATFFLLGRNAAMYPKLVGEIRDAGHTLGGHTWDHANLTELPLALALDNAQAGNRAVEDAAGLPVALFRFPYVATTPPLSATIAEAGLIDVTVTVDGADWTRISTRASADRIMTKLEQDGRRGIILLHDPFSGSEQRTRHLLRRLKEEGYRIVHITGPAENQP